MTQSRESKTFFVMTVRLHQKCSLAFLFRCSFKRYQLIFSICNFYHNETLMHIINYRLQNGQFGSKRRFEKGGTKA